MECAYFDLIFNENANKKILNSMSTKFARLLSVCSAGRRVEHIEVLQNLKLLVCMYLCISDIPPRIKTKKLNE